MILALSAAQPAPARADPLSLGSTAGYALLALEGGALSINSASTIVGDVGFSRGVDVVKAQKVDAFTGAAQVYSGGTTADFNATHAPATFDPSGGIKQGGAADADLDRANADAMALRTALDALVFPTPATFSTDLTINGSGGLNLFDVVWDYNGNTLTLNGGPNDWFVFRSAGTSHTWAQSRTVLNGVDVNHVLFYFTSATLGSNAFKVSKAASSFSGTIFAPDGRVEYHNPADFVGRIVAESIVVHSDFNIANPPVPADTPNVPEAVPVPEPASWLLVATGVGGLVLKGRRRVRPSRTPAVLR